MATEDLFDWEELLLYIRDRRVVPIVGRGLLTVEEGGEKLLLDQVLARRLADQLKVDVSDLSQPDLRVVAGRYMEGKGRRQRIYAKLRAILDSEQFPIPEPLRKLASITDFTLFLSTTFDGLLIQALNEVRFNGRKETVTLSFSPFSRIEDIAPEEEIRRPTVFRVFGKATSCPEYAVTEEDTLEFLHALQSETRRPQNLFDKLRDNHLLFLGCHFPDWLARFFIRTVRNDRLLSGADETAELVVDAVVSHDQNLVHFLQQHEMQVFGGDDPVAFVDELHGRWGGMERDASVDGRMTPEQLEGADMPEGAVFLSYARQDREAAERMEQALGAAGIEAWFDRRDLKPGIDWETEIRANIRRCSAFVPLISRTTELRREAFFRVEWKLALQRAMRMDDTLRFVFPVIIDDLPEAQHVPPEFFAKQFTRLPNGFPSPDFAGELKQEVRNARGAANYR